jgi:hypothetical protein
MLSYGLALVAIDKVVQVEQICPPCGSARVNFKSILRIQRPLSEVLGQNCEKHKLNFEITSIRKSYDGTGGKH